MLGHAQVSAVFCGCAETGDVAGRSVARARQRAGRGFPWPWTLPAHEQALCVPCAPQEPHGVVGWLLRSRNVPSVTSVPKGGISATFLWLSTGSRQQVTTLLLREVLDVQKKCFAALSFALQSQGELTGTCLWFLAASASSSQGQREMRNQRRTWGHCACVSPGQGCLGCWCRPFGKSLFP